MPEAILKPMQRGDISLRPYVVAADRSQMRLRTLGLHIHLAGFLNMHNNSSLR